MPATSAIRQLDRSDYLESVQHLDRNVGHVMAWLDREGLADDTIVFFLSDHGEAFLRGKCFLYDCSLNQPLPTRDIAAASSLSEKGP